MSSSRISREGALKNLWESFQSSSESISEASASSSSSISRSFESSARSVNWMITNRGGLALIAGLMMVPSQFLGYDISISRDIVNGAISNERDGCKIESFKCLAEGDDVEGIICYPRGWNSEDTSRCVFYSNPNGITIPGYFDDNRLSYTPKDLLELYKCPVVLFDYRGTGLSQEARSSSSTSFRPTYESVVQDGLAALRVAFDNFDSVEVWGSSLGGGVSTAALDRFLKANPGDAERAKLFNHDSFTTTPRVVMPSMPRLSSWLGWAVGGLLDAQTPMKSLIERRIEVTVLCHDQDPVIPKGARMSEFVNSLPVYPNVSVISSPDYGHANLSSDMKKDIQEIIK